MLLHPNLNSVNVDVKLVRLRFPLNLKLNSSLVRYIGQCEQKTFTNIKQSSN